MNGATEAALLINKLKEVENNLSRLHKFLEAAPDIVGIASLKLELDALACKARHCSLTELQAGARALVYHMHTARRAVQDATEHEEPLPFGFVDEDDYFDCTLDEYAEQHGLTDEEVHEVKRCWSTERRTADRRIK